MSVPSPKIKIIAAAIVGIATLLAIASSWTDAPVVDEVPHIGAGYSYVTQLDYRLNPEHPPLVKDVAGLSLLLLKLDQRAFTTPDWTTEVNGQWNFGRSLIFGSGNNADTIKNVARMAVLLVFFLSAAYYLWRWSYERYGDTGALIATTLWSFSPTVLAHARLVTTDVAAATGILIATYYFLQLLRNPTRRTGIWAAAALGIALLCKFNNALLGPYFVLVAIIYALDGRISQKTLRRAGRAFLMTALIGMGAFVFVWAVYLVQTAHYPIARQHADTLAIASGQPNILTHIAVWTSDKPIIRAVGHWVLGLGMVAQRSAGGNTIYWLGRVVTAGGPWYFPIVYFIKEPLAWWFLAAMAFTTMAFHRHRHHGEPANGSWFTRHTDEWIMLLWLVIYWAVSIHSTLNIGIRHLLPVYPFTIILVAGRLSVLIDWLRQHDHARLKIVSAIIAVLLGWYVFESVHVFPYYLTYFNQLAGGPSGGYRYVTDSNLDWGQDLRRLGIWLQGNSISRISLDYFGWSDPAYYLKTRSVWTTASQWKDAQDFARRNISDGWLAVSGTFLQESIYKTNQSQGTYRWLLSYTPVTVIGNSIFIYHIGK